MTLSIDQNSTPLWDTLPKLHALSRHGHQPVHYIEDIDVAFTAIGASPDDPPHIGLERYYPGGQMDWGASLFYSSFLGRVPLDLQQLEEPLGMKITTLAKKANADIHTLYENWSVADNWMLIGPSYVGDQDHHRLIGDLSAEETAPHLREMLDLAEQDCLHRFPAGDSQQRTRSWFARQRRQVNALLNQECSQSLPDLYHRWLVGHLDSSVSVAMTSNLLATGADPHRTALMDLFLQDYATVADLYNRAIDETGVSVHPLNTDIGELPFFAIRSHQGHLVRTAMHLEERVLKLDYQRVELLADNRLPVERLHEVGITALAGKAVLLALQARVGHDGGALALPVQGSLYMPAALRFEQLLEQGGLLDGVTFHPILRVRLGLLDRMNHLETPIALPPHLQDTFGREVIAARDFSRHYRDIQQASRQRLDAFSDSDRRTAWQRQHLSTRLEKIDRLQQRKQQLARENPKDRAVREIWGQIKQLQGEVLLATLRRVVYDAQTVQLEYWDSRGATWPWAVALGGEEFYQQVIDQADIFPETLNDDV